MADPVDFQARLGPQGLAAITEEQIRLDAKVERVKDNVEHQYRALGERFSRVEILAESANTQVTQINNRLSDMEGRNRALDRIFQKLEESHGDSNKDMRSQQRAFDRMTGAAMVVGLLISVATAFVVFRFEAQDKRIDANTHRIEQLERKP